uniref:Uncharacterized protein n=1 Tax=Ditylenchus dipsaci TaxID=166011 RepID=A0A915D2F5_9BILA
MVARCEYDNETIERKRQRTRKFSFHSILDVPSGVPLVDIFAIEISDKKQIAKLLLLLPVFPRKLHHLKRISGNTILICEEINEIGEEKISEIKNLPRKNSQC